MVCQQYGIVFNANHGLKDPKLQVNAPHASSVSPRLTAPSPEGAQGFAFATFLRDFPTLLPRKELRPQAVRMAMRSIFNP